MIDVDTPVGTRVIRRFDQKLGTIAELGTAGGDGPWATVVLDCDGETWCGTLPAWDYAVSLVKGGRACVRITTPEENTMEFIHDLFELINNAMDAEFTHGQEYSDDSRIAVNNARSALWRKARDLYDYTFIPVEDDA